MDRDSSHTAQDSRPTDGSFRTACPGLSTQGLSTQEVEQRRAQGLSNRVDITTEKTTKDILISNIFTYFNLIFLIIAVLLCMVGSFRNLTFLPVIIGNTVIGIVQELRAKQVLERMNILNAPHATVIRDGREMRAASEELVLDDTILLSAGDQICADAVVLDGTIAVNESLLTGEADEVEKCSGSMLFSGSFVVAGRCHARLTQVGNQSYLSRLTAEAKIMGSEEQSEMIRSVNKLVKWIGILVLPVSIALFCQAFFVNHEGLSKSVTSMVAAVIGMIPEGLYLLTTIALALGTIRLSRKKVLLHDMKSIETLARVDVLCVDKTGTITNPDMCLTQIVSCPGASRTFPALQSDQAVLSLLTDYLQAIPDNNATMQAIRSGLPALMREEEAASAGTDRSAVRTGSPAAAGNLLGSNNVSGTFRPASGRTVRCILPFSSARKYSSVTFLDQCCLLGAPEFIMGDSAASIQGDLAALSSGGKRVLLFAACKGLTADGAPASEVIPLAYLILENPIREHAADTFSYFKEQDVAIKVISGDSARTVSEVAAEAGIEHAECYIDLSAVPEGTDLVPLTRQYTVFGRVTPRQKQLLIAAMKSDSHTVAMTGDGVNDILAMKDADCSIAMASGCEAATQAAQIVLLDSDFSRMPGVVAEGRQVVNNIQRSASLFLVKNIFSFLLSVFVMCCAITYPLEPSQVSLISMFTIGLPGFLLALEPNTERIRGHFLPTILSRALPAGLTDLFAVSALVICGNVFSLPTEDIATSATVLLALVGLMVLIRISHPFNPLKYSILALAIAGLILCSCFLSGLFAMSDISTICVLLIIVFGFGADSVYHHLAHLSDKVLDRF